MKRVIALPFIIAILLVASCKKEVALVTSPADEEAQALSDSLRDTKELTRWMTHYQQDGERRATLIIRQMVGKSYRDCSNFEEAIHQHDTCINEARELKDTLQLIIAINNQATNFRRIGDLQEAGNMHYEALELCDAFSDKDSPTAKKNRVRSLNGAANVLLSQKNLKAAEDLLTQALQGEAELGSATGQAINLANLGSIKEQQGDWQAAKDYYDQSMQKNREAKNAVGVSLCYLYLGHLYDTKGDHAKALENYKLSYYTGIETGDIWHWLEPCHSLAELYLEECRTDSAAFYIEQALKASQEIHSLDNIATSYALRSRLNEMRGDQAGALADLHNSMAYNDSVKLEESKDEMQNLRVNYEAHRRSQELREAELETEKEKAFRNIALIAGILILVAAVITIVTIFVAVNRRRKTTQERQLFYRNVTHMLLTPMTVVSGMVSQLRTHIPKKPELLESMDALERQSKELHKLIKQMNEATREGKDIVTTELFPAPLSDDSISVVKTKEKEHTPIMGPYILVVDDTPDVALLLNQMLKDEGHEVRTARDGAEALDIMKERLPELLITDIMMPNMDGIELCKRIRSNEGMNHLGIIVVSARVEDNEQIEGLEAGAEVYLAKPFNPGILISHVRRMLEQRKALKHKFVGDDIPTSNISNKDAIFMQQLDQYIRENLANSEQNSSSCIAQHLGISVSTLTRRLKALTGANPSAYIMKQRLMTAERLVSNTTMSMGEIQTMCGFESPSYFSRAFSDRYGMPPLKYRKQKQESL